MKIRALAVSAAFALGTALSGGAAHAATYLLDTSASFGTGSFGTVTVTGTSTDLHFDVKLTGPTTFVDTGSHSTFTGRLGGTISNLVLPDSEYSNGNHLTGNPDFTLTTSSTSSITNSPFSGFNFALGCADFACGNGGGLPHFGTELIFDIIGTGLSVLQADPYNNENIYFAADVFNGTTGAIGGGPPGGVPEPASWAMMLVGAGMVGGVMRMQRKSALATA